MLWDCVSQGRKDTDCEEGETKKRQFKFTYRKLHEFKGQDVIPKTAIPCTPTRIAAKGRGNQLCEYVRATLLATGVPMLCRRWWVVILGVAHKYITMLSLRKQHAMWHKEGFRTTSP